MAYEPGDIKVFNPNETLDNCINNRFRGRIVHSFRPSAGQNPMTTNDTSLETHNETVEL